MKLPRLNNIGIRYRMILLGGIASLVIIVSISAIIIPGQAAVREKKISIQELQQSLALEESSTTNLIIAKRRLEN